MLNQVKNVPPWALWLAAGVALYVVLKPNDAGQSIGAAVGGVIFEGVGGIVEGVATAAGNKLAPNSPNNIIYDDIIGGIGRGATGNKSWSLGVSIYDFFND